MRWAFCLYLTWILCPLRFCAPSRESADNTWFFALNYAAAHHLTFGKDFFWTWGPLAYLLVPFSLGHNLIWGLIFQSSFWVLVFAALWDLLVHAPFPIRNVQAFGLCMGVSAILYVHGQDLNPGNFLMPLALIFLVHYQLRGGWWRLAIALLLIGILPLFQFVASVPAAAMLGAFAVLRAWKREPGWLPVVVATVCIPAAAFGVGTWIFLGSLDALAGYLKGNAELARGYVFAMSLPGSPLQLVLATAAALLLLAILALLVRLRAENAWFFGAILAVPMVYEFRHAIVRQDDSHVTPFFCFVWLALGLIGLSLPLARRAAEGAAAGAALAMFLLTWPASSLHNVSRTLEIVTGSGIPGKIWQATHYASLTASLQSVSEEQAAKFGLDPEMRGMIGTSRVAFLAPFYSHMLGHGMQIELPPVPQGYSLFTPYLDRADARWVAERGPEFLVFDETRIDDRHAWSEAPQTWTEVYRWYDARALGKAYLLLKRRTQPRFAAWQPVETKQIRFGESAEVPAAGSEYFWTLQCELNGTGKLRSLLLSVPEVKMTVTLANGKRFAYRTLLAVSGYPTPADQLPLQLNHYAFLLDDKLRRDTVVKTMQFDGPGASSYRQPCGLTFLKVR